MKEVQKNDGVADGCMRFEWKSLNKYMTIDSSTRYFEALEVSSKYISFSEFIYLGQFETIISPFKTLPIRAFHCCQ